MEGDDWDDAEGSGVVVPVSLIRQIAFEIMHTVDVWHEDREIHTLDLKKVAVAILAAGQAAIEMMSNYPDEETIQ